MKPLLATIDWPTTLRCIVLTAGMAIGMYALSGALYDAWDLWKGEE